MLRGPVSSRGQTLTPTCVPLKQEIFIQDFLDSPPFSPGHGPASSPLFILTSEVVLAAPAWPGLAENAGAQNPYIKSPARTSAHGPRDGQSLPSPGL